MFYKIITKSATYLAVLPLALGVLSHSAQANIEQLYQKSCATCHEAGTFNAPKTGDTATWQKLMNKKGMDGLVASTKKGLPQMPAMGLCQTCSDKQFAQLIKYMAK